MTMRRDARLRPGQNANQGRYQQDGYPGNGQGRVRLLGTISVDLMTGREVQEADRPVAHSDSPVVRAVADFAAAAALACGSLGINIPAPHVGERATVHMVPDIMPRGKR